MTPAARVQAAIELLDEIIAAARSEGAPADRIIAAYFKQRRYAGSKDRRAVRELVYAVIRAIGPVPLSGRDAMIAYASEPENAHILECFDGSIHGPAPLEAGAVFAEAGVAPDWLVQVLTRSGIEGEAASALLERAPLDIRVNNLKADRANIDLPETGEALAAPQALRFAYGTPVEQWPQYREGALEVQDHGSQLACLAANAKPGETVIDLCAGAGGKTLALAAMMRNEGRLLATDTNRARLSRLGPRAERAGAGLIETRLLDPGKELEALVDHLGQTDLVVIDAPCSGTGTWRRKPEAKWRLTPERLKKYAEMQSRLLGIAAKLAKPGGRIAFVTCSLIDQEGADRIAEFLQRHRGWSAEKPEVPLGSPHGNGVRLDPFHHGTDGFFIAIVRSAC